MKILHIINAPSNSFVQFIDQNANSWREPIVALCLSEADGERYVDLLVMSDDGEIEQLTKIKSFLDDTTVIEKIIWNGK